MSGRRTKKKSRGAGRGAARPLKRVILTKGDWLDVMDSDGVWNVARVLSVSSPGEVKIKYDGWPPEYDEVVRIDSDRVAPYHTFTWAVKCWVRYLNWPLWPSLITIRPPGNAKGVEHLRRENRLLVDFLDNPDFGKRDRCWNMKRNVRAFDKDFDENRKHTNGDMFENSLQLMLQSNATKKMPRFVKGTLPSQYATSVTEPVSEIRRTMGEDLWLRNFANNRERHFLTHVYENVGREPRDGSEGESSNEGGGDDQVSISDTRTEEPLEITYKSDDDSGEDAGPKRKPTMKTRRSRVLSPKVESQETKPKIEHHPVSPTAAGKVFPSSVIVAKNEIIVLDDDDEDDSDRHVSKRRSKRPRLSSTPRSRAPSTPRVAPPKPSTLRVASPKPSTPRAAAPKSSTPRKARRQETTPRATPAAAFPPKKASPQPSPKRVPQPTVTKETRRPRKARDVEDDDKFVPDVSFEPDAKEPSPNQGGTPQHRKLPAKEIAAKTREHHSRRLGLNSAGDAHREAWLTILNQADPKDPPSTRSSSERGEAKAYSADDNRGHKRNSSNTAAASRISPDAEVIDEFEHSFISPDANWADNSIEYDGAEALADEEDSAKSSPSRPMPPSAKRNGSAAARARTTRKGNNVMDVDAVQVQKSPPASLAQNKRQLSAVKPSMRDAPGTATTSGLRKKSPRSYSKRSLLDQSIAAAQAVMASMATSDQANTIGQERASPARKKRLKVAGAAVRTDSYSPESVPAKVSGATPSARMALASPRPNLGTPRSVAAPLWTRAAHDQAGHNHSPSQVEVNCRGPTDSPAVAALSPDSDEETKTNEISDPPVIDSAEMTPVEVESSGIETPPPFLASFGEPSMDATSGSAESPSRDVNGLDRLLMASESISSPVFQTTMNTRNPAPMSLEVAAASKSEVVPEIPRRFCMMRVGERVGPSLDAQTKTKTFRDFQHPFMLVSAPRKFGDDITPLSMTSYADTRDNRSTSESVSSASSSLAHSMLHLSTLNGTAPPSVVASSSSRPPPPGMFSSSGGFAMRSWFKRNLYTSFLSPHHQT